MNHSNDHVSMALFCDFENVALGVRDTKFQKFDIRPVLERLLLKGSIVVKKAYCDWERYKEFKAPMHEANFELIEIPHVRQSGKNSADIRLVVDALDFCYTKSHVNTFVIISGDSDFSPLVSKLRENNKTVIGVGVKQSTSDLLVANCDEFIFYDDLARESQRAADSRRDNRSGSQSTPRRSPEEIEARRTEAVEMVVETFEALMAERGDSGTIWASVVKEALKRRRPDFNESYYGFRAFGNVLEEAQARGYFEVGRAENSSTYVYRQAAESFGDAAPPVRTQGATHTAAPSRTRLPRGAQADRVAPTVETGLPTEDTPAEIETAPSHSGKRGRTRNRRSNKVADNHKADFSEWPASAPVVRNESAASAAAAPAPAEATHVSPSMPAAPDSHARRENASSRPDNAAATAPAASNNTQRPAPVRSGAGATLPPMATALGQTSATDAMSTRPAGALPPMPTRMGHAMRPDEQADGQRSRADDGARTTSGNAAKGKTQKTRDARIPDTVAASQPERAAVKGGEAKTSNTVEAAPSKASHAKPSRAEQNATSQTGDAAALSKGGAAASKAGKTATSRARKAVPSQTGTTASSNAGEPVTPKTGSAVSSKAGAGASSPVGDTEPATADGSTGPARKRSRTATAKRAETAAAQTAEAPSESDSPAPAKKATRSTASRTRRPRKTAAENDA